jgi:hypothetical protein
MERSWKIACRGVVSASGPCLIVRETRSRMVAGSRLDWKPWKIQTERAQITLSVLLRKNFEKTSSLT